MKQSMIDGNPDARVFGKKNYPCPVSQVSKLLKSDVHISTGEGGRG